MATQAEYSVVANALVKRANAFMATLSGFAAAMLRNYVTPDKVDAAAGELAKVAVDALDEYRAKEKAS